MTDFDTTVKALRRWAAHQDPHDRAAVELLISHETWLRRGDFPAACIQPVENVLRIDWRAAREFAGDGLGVHTPLCSTTQLAVLRIAVAIAMNDFRLTIMGRSNARRIVQAFMQALGEEEAGSG